METVDRFIMSPQIQKNEFLHPIHEHEAIVLQARLTAPVLEYRYQTMIQYESQKGLAHDTLTATDTQCIYVFQVHHPSVGDVCLNSSRSVSCRGLTLFSSSIQRHLDRFVCRLALTIDRIVLVKQSPHGESTWTLT